MTPPIRHHPLFKTHDNRRFVYRNPESGLTATVTCDNCGQGWEWYVEGLVSCLANGEAHRKMQAMHESLIAMREWENRLT